MNLDIFHDTTFLAKIDKHFRSYKKVSLEVLEGVYENQGLFDIFAFYATYMSTSFEKIAHLKEDRIVVFVQQLNIYGLITKAGYKEFCVDLVEKKIDPRIYQLILTNEKQKVVLLCDNSIKSEVESKFCRVLNDMIHITPGENMCEITLQNKFVDNYEEAQKVYLDIIERLTPLMGNIGEYLTIIVPIMGPIPYLKCNISDTVPKIGRNKYKYKELLEELLKSPTKTQFIIMGDMINPKIITGDTKVIKDKHEETKNWIASNQPTGMIKSEYYELYQKSDISQKMSKQLFGRIMADLGYKEGYKGKTRIWK